MASRFRYVALVAAAALIVGACSSSATPSPTAAPTQAPVVTTAPNATPAPVVTAAPTQVITGSVPADQLVVAGRLTVCSDMPYPPQEFFDADGNPTGSDIDLGNEIANRLGLKLSVQNTVFDTIIAALAGDKCDIIISAQDINAGRLKEVDMIPYFNSGQAFVVAKGNPSGIKATTDLCGKSVGVENGTTEADHLNGAGDYKPADGLNAQCLAAGKAKIDVQPFTKDSDALLALQSNKVAVYFTDAPVAGYYTVKQPDQFELAPGLLLSAVKQGISVSKTKTALSAAVKTALQSMIDDGSYVQVLKKYGLEANAIKSTNP